MTTNWCSRILSELVRAAGLEVHTMDDGSTTLALLEQHFTPIVITDLNMPAMDGLALCRAIRQQVSPGFVSILLAAVTRCASSRPGMVRLEIAADWSFERPLGYRIVALRPRSERITGLGVSRAHAKTGSQPGRDQHVAV